MKYRILYWFLGRLRKISVITSRLENRLDKWLWVNSSNEFRLKK